MTLAKSEHRILVLGAGYTGMISALGAARRTRRHGGTVTLVNASARFTERLRMHQIATGQKLGNHQIHDLVQGTGIEFVQGRVTRLDAEARTVAVETADGVRVLGYDTLVYALGSAADTSQVPGADAHAHTLNGVRAAKRLAGRLTELEPLGGTVLVCGGGLTGIEAATEIAESHPGVQVQLISRQEPGSMMGDRARAYMHRSLERLGVTVRVGVGITKVLPDAVELAGGELVPADAVVWTTGMVAGPLAADAGIAVDDRGRIEVDATLRSQSHPNIYAIGDAAAVPQSYGVLHGTCQSGMPTGVHAAISIARQLRGKQPNPFRFGYFHQPVSLGRNDAVIQFTHPDDTPGRFYLTGRWAIAYKKYVTGSPFFNHGGTFPTSRRIAIPASMLSRRGGRRNPALAA